MQKILIVFVWLVFTLFACDSEIKNKNYLPELELDIPQELSENSHAVEFMQSSTASLNTWCIVFEDISIDYLPLLAKAKEEELSAMDKLRLGALTVQYAVKLSEFAEQLSEFEQVAIIIKDGLSADEVSAFNGVVRKFESRIYEIGQRYIKDTNTNDLIGKDLS